MPIRRRRYSARPFSFSVPRSSPCTTMGPDVGRSSPATMLSSVDLPLPDGPITATASPALDLQRHPVQCDGFAVLLAYGGEPHDRLSVAFVIRHAFTLGPVVRAGRQPAGVMSAPRHPGDVRRAPGG